MSRSSGILRRCFDGCWWACAVAMLVLIAAPIAARDRDGTTTERLYLSGTGLGDAVSWDFRCSDGRGCGEWTTIAVPSQWELQGFGTYDYGYRDEVIATETADYRHTFEVPDTWQARRVTLVFEGVMTDALVRVNGIDAGAEHQGGFTRFTFDVGALLHFDGENTLEVRVRKHSADASVNRAEREADYWVFGGIYRPVYLRADPASSIDRVAIDARHGGQLRAAVAVHGAEPGDRVSARVRAADGTFTGPLISGTVAASTMTDETATDETAPVVLEGDVPGTRSWSAETPVRYQLEVTLARAGVLLHRTRTWFGFRTIELRPGVGLYVNDRRVRLKGFNRHAFWPTSGRTLNASIDRRDVELMLAMNANAVRTSHYPPDPAFLDACDELGLYVIDELPGWKEAYDTTVGRGLVREMVERDRNHPSILFWANGNEGGWNPALDGDFAQHDPQRRPVLHPEAVAGGVDTVHYPSYDELRQHLETGAPPSSWWQRLVPGHRGDEPLPLVMPTEMLHGLYDGGGGAGLADYWSLIRASERGLGGFLWSLADESVARTDQGWRLDSAGNLAPDGVVDAERRPEGSVQTIRAVWSPVQVTDVAFGASEGGGVAAEVTVENRFDHTDLSDCAFTWQWVRFPAIGAAGAVGLESMSEGGRVPGPPASPGETGVLRLPMRTRATSFAPDALRLSAFDPHGRERMTWMLPIRSRSSWVQAQFADKAEALDAWTPEDDDGYGQLGPWLFDASAPGVESVAWDRHASGWLRLRYRLRGGSDAPGWGLRLAYPRERVRAVRWLGGGPFPVWGNRRAGARLGLWSRVRAGGVGAPAFAGLYTSVYWATLDTDDGCLDVVLESDDATLSLFNPTFGVEPETATADLPADGVGIRHALPSIGTKFHPPEALAPPRTRSESSVSGEGAVWLRFAPGCPP